MTSSFLTRLERALAEMPQRPTQADLARAAGVRPASVSDWFSGKSKSLGKSLLPISRFLGVNPDWLRDGRGPMRPASNATEPAYMVAEASAYFGAGSEIPLIDARGSCGGGALAWDLEQKPPLIKEPSWFRRYGVKADEVFAVFADGDSMADYIVDGDIVIFDRTKQEPRSGAIFLIDHPDGLKIKRMRREIDGSWVLESMNPDKRRYPDERITVDQADLLKIKGQFVYRQGG